MSYYTYVHRAGYGRDDHMADEIIARSARQLGLDTGSAIAQHCGMASHSCPMPASEVRIPSAPGVRRRMLRAIRAAEREVLSHDCLISVELRRTRRERVRSYRYVENGALVDVTEWRIVLEERRGREWREIDSWEGEATTTPVDRRAGGKHRRGTSREGLCFLSGSRPSGEMA